VLRFWIAKLHMVLFRRSKLEEQFVKGRVVPLGVPEYSMSKAQFQQFHQNFHFPIQLIKLFNDIFCSFVCTVVVLPFSSFFFFFSFFLLIFSLSPY
jgi:hypothetical protein